MTETYEYTGPVFFDFDLDFETTRAFGIPFKKVSYALFVPLNSFTSSFLAYPFAIMSTRSLSATPSCPRTCSHVTVCFRTSARSSCHISLLSTSFFSFVCHPFFSQPKTHFVMPFMTYCESVLSVSVVFGLQLLSAMSDAVISIRLLVVWRALPPPSYTVFPERTTKPHPPGPGFPIALPSVYAVIFSIRESIHGAIACV